MSSALFFYHARAHVQVPNPRALTQQRETAAAQRLDVAIRAPPGTDLRRHTWLNPDNFNTAWATCWPQRGLYLAGDEILEVNPRHFFGIPLFLRTRAQMLQDGKASLPGKAWPSHCSWPRSNPQKRFWTQFSSEKNGNMALGFKQKKNRGRPWRSSYCVCLSLAPWAPCPLPTGRYAPAVIRRAGNFAC